MSEPTPLSAEDIRALHEWEMEWLTANGLDASGMIRRMLASIDAQATEIAALKGALGMDRTWPLTSVLEKLIEAHDHLMGRHDCDGHGYEVWNTAADKARDILESLNARVLAGKEAR